MPKYALTLTCVADSAEEMMRMLDFKKKELEPLLVSMVQIDGTRAVLGETTDVTLAGLMGERGSVKYTIRSYSPDKTALPAFVDVLVTSSSDVRKMAKDAVTNIAKDVATYVPPVVTAVTPPSDAVGPVVSVERVPDDKPADCQAEGTGGNCGGLNKCDQTGVCAVREKPND